jgi:cytoskeletal protein CcmA (bactofilin family)
MALFQKKQPEQKPGQKPVSRPEPKPEPKTEVKKAAPAQAPSPQRDTTFFTKKLKITGNLSGEGNLIIQGVFDGEFDLRGQLKIAQGARVKGNVKAHDISVNGNVEGNLTASEKVHLDSTAKINGRITTPKISVSEGAVFDGEIKMSRATTPSSSASSTVAKK